MPLRKFQFFINFYSIYRLVWPRVTCHHFVTSRMDTLYHRKLRWFYPFQQSFFITFFLLFFFRRFILSLAEEFHIFIFCAQSYVSFSCVLCERVHFYYMQSIASASRRWKGKRYIHTLSWLNSGGALSWYWRCTMDIHENITYQLVENIFNFFHS